VDLGGMCCPDGEEAYQPTYGGTSLACCKKDDIVNTNIAGTQWICSCPMSRIKMPAAQALISYVDVHSSDCCPEGSTAVCTDWDVWQITCNTWECDGEAATTEVYTSLTAEATAMETTTSYGFDDVENSMSISTETSTPGGVSTETSTPDVSTETSTPDVSTETTTLPTTTTDGNYMTEPTTVPIESTKPIETTTPIKQHVCYQYCVKRSR
jgi:hypothetical protein